MVALYFVPFALCAAALPTAAQPPSAPAAQPVSAAVPPSPGAVEGPLNGPANMPQIAPQIPPLIQAEIINIVQDRTARMTVPVGINGQGPFSFLVDTGSERTAISYILAEQLALEFAEPATLVSVAGTKRVDTVYIPELTLGRQNYGEVVGPLLRALDMGAEGILGLDGLQDQRILFDFRNNQISVEEVSGLAAKRGFEIVVTARRRSGQLIVTQAKINGVRVNVVIDTGAQSNIGNRALQNKLRGGRARGTDIAPTALIAVTGQSITADAGVVSDFRMGRAQFSQIGIAFADSPAFAQLGLEDRPAILLGMSTLRKFDRVAIDFKKRQILFDVPPS